MNFPKKISFILGLLPLSDCGSRGSSENNTVLITADSTIIVENISQPKNLHNALHITNEKVFCLYSIWDERDTLTRPSWNELRTKSIPDLRDTVKSRLVFVDYEKIFTDKIDLDGNLCVIFDYCRQEYRQKSNYIFPLKVYRNIDEKTTFEIDWYRAFSRKNHSSDVDFISYVIHNRNDTIITYTETYPAGGTTPEGHTFRFTGEQIDSIKVKSKVFYSVAQGFDINGRDDWGVGLYYLESEWVDLSIDNLSYVLPVLDTIFIDRETFSKIRNKAISVQKDVLINQRDSLENLGGLAGRYYQDVIGSVLKRLKPNFEDAETATDLYIFVDLKYFTNNVTVFYKGGRAKELVHIADYIVSVP